MFLDASTFQSLSLLTLRDILIASSHLVVLLLYQQDVCTQVYAAWLIIDLTVTLIRILRNPFYYYFMDSSLYLRLQCCNMSLFYCCDWLTYFCWILGTYMVHNPSQMCASNVLVLYVYYQVTISTYTYMGIIVMYILVYLVHKGSNGWCFPGYIYNNSRFPEQCPSISFDRRYWRRRGENVESYRQRIQTITTQPRRIWMAITGMSEEEISAIPTVVFECGEKSDSVMEAVEIVVEGKSGDVSLGNVNTAETIVNDESVVGVSTLARDQSLSRSETRRRTLERFIQSSMQSESCTADREGINMQEISVSRSQPQTLSQSLSQTQSKSALSTQTLSNPQQPSHLDHRDWETNITCLCCIENYEHGQVLRELRCGHRFHMECIDEWLRLKATCPACKMQMRQ